MKAISPPHRPALRWHGGKWKLAPWIVGHFPAHRIYVEPYGGAASVLLRKDRAYAEIYNDLDGAVVTLFRVLRDPVQAAELIRRLELTPFARAEFEAAYLATDDPIETARRLCIRSFMGFGSDGHNPATRTGFRANSNRSGTTPGHDWAHYPAALARVAARVAARVGGLVIECRPAIEVMRAHDGPETLHYVDPPYLPATRSAKSRRGGGKYHAYAHEMTAADHGALLACLRDLRGMVVLSGYPSAAYDGALPGWRRVVIAALADGARARTECLWLNPAATARREHGPLWAVEGAP
jgi:DNA adenine methylase